MEVVLSNQAKKQFAKLPPSEKKKIKKKLLSLNENPLSGKKLSGELNRFCSLRAWPYRIIYSLNNSENRVEVADIEHRQGVYK